MTNEMAQKQLQSELQPQLQSDTEYDQFVSFLVNNPDIFQRQPGLLDSLQLSDQRGTASLLERQINRLQQRLHSIQTEHDEMFDLARENEQISNNFSDVIGKLISYRDLAGFAGDFSSSLKHAFSIDEVSIKTSFAMSKKPNDAESYSEALRRLTHKKSVCDNRWPSNILSVFFSPEIHSAALIPLRETEGGEIIGVLGLGAMDSERYTQNLGTAHLDRLGTMCGMCLARLQPGS